jgi:hypothetical protein
MAEPPGTSWLGSVHIPAGHPLLTHLRRLCVVLEIGMEFYHPLMFKMIQVDI